MFILGLAVLVIFFLFGNRSGEPQVSDNELTNQANMELFAATQTAEFELQSQPTEEPAPSAADNNAT